MATVPSQKTNKSSGFAAPLILIVLVALIFGGIGGYLYGKKNVKQNPNLDFDSKSASQKLLDDPTKAWGSLVNKTYAEIEVEGVVTAIKDGTGGAEGNQGPGKVVTLKDETSEATFFILSSGEWREGNRQKFPWHQIKADDVKVGDRLTVYVRAPLTPEATIDNYYGFWVLRNI